MLTSSNLAELSRRLYATEHWRWKFIQSLRPYICPFGEVMELVPQDAHVLDVGCGSGLFLLLLTSLGRISRGVGFDISRNAIAAARAAAGTLSDARRVEFSVRAVQDGIPHGDWTAVSAIDVIHHIPPPYQAGFVRDLCAATPPGGRLIIKDMVAAPWWRALANRLHDLVMARQWVHHASPETVKSWVDQSMECVHQARTTMLWYGHWTLVFERAPA